MKKNKKDKDKVIGILILSSFAIIIGLFGIILSLFNNNYLFHPYFALTIFMAGLFLMTILASLHK